MRKLRAGLAVLALSLLAGAAPAPGAGKTVRVLVATRDVAAGDALRAEDLADKEIPAEWASSSVVKSADRDYVVSQRVSSPVLRGDMIRWSAMLVGSEAEFPACRRAVREPESAAASVARSRRRILERR